MPPRTRTALTAEMDELKAKAKAAQAKVHAIWGPLNSGEALATTPIMARAKMPDIHPCVVESLIALQLAATAGEGPVITPKGRSVLLRGARDRPPPRGVWRPAKPGA